MRPHDTSPLDAWDGACRNLRQVEIEALTHRGVPHVALARDPYPASGFVIRAARVVEQPDVGLFDFSTERDDDPAAQGALIVPLRDETGDVADLLAWFPQADRAALWADNVCLAGQQELGLLCDDQPLQVRCSILDWLRHGRSGVVVLDDVRAASMLHGVTLATPDITAGRALASRLTLAPRIVVPVPDMKRAA